MRLLLAVYLVRYEGCLALWAESMGYEYACPYACDTLAFSAWMHGYWAEYHYAMGSPD